MKKKIMILATLSVVLGLGLTTNAISDNRANQQSFTPNTGKMSLVGEPEDLPSEAPVDHTVAMPTNPSPSNESSTPPQETPAPAPAPTPNTTPTPEPEVKVEGTNKSVDATRFDMFQVN